MNKLNIHVGGSFSDDTGRILAAATRAEAGKPIEEEIHVSFENWETLFRALSRTRIARLKARCRGPYRVRG
jgi:predicted transcriptional regulator